MAELWPGTTIYIQWDIHRNGVDYSLPVVRCIVNGPRDSHIVQAFDSVSNADVLVFPRVGLAQLEYPIPRIPAAVGTWTYRWEAPALDSAGTQRLDQQGHPIYLASEENAFQITASTVREP